jgi:hypothetical protein
MAGDRQSVNLIDCVIDWDNPQRNLPMGHHWEGRSTTIIGCGLAKQAIAMQIVRDSLDPLETVLLGRRWCFRH